MGRPHLLTGFILAALWASLLSITPALAVPPPLDPPPGFEPVSSALGVNLYRRDYGNGSPDFVQVIDLSTGASVQILHAPIANPGTGEGVYGGDNPRFRRQGLRDYWGEIKSITVDAFCVNTGEFFYMPEYPSGLAFPIKKDGALLTDGYGINEYPGKKIMIELWPGRADIIELTPENLHNSTAPNIIAGLTEDANKRAKFAVGRTFVGIDDRDGDAQYETIYILSTLVAKQVEAAATLREFGADKVMMLDGGGSAQLLCQGETLVSSDRLLPQVLATVAGSHPPTPQLAAQFITQPGWYEVIAGDEVQVVVEIQNTGAETWKSGSVHLLVEMMPANTVVDAPLQNETPSGGIGTFAWLMPPLEPENVYSGTMRLAKDGELFPIEPLTFNTAVLPPALASQQTEFNAQLQSWAATPEAPVGKLAIEWMEINKVDTPLEVLKENVAAVQTTIVEPVMTALSTRSIQTHLTDVLLIPAMMAPVTIIVLMIMTRQRMRARFQEVDYEDDYYEE